MVCRIEIHDDGMTEKSGMTKLGGRIMKMGRGRRSGALLTEKVLLPQEIQHVKGLAGVLRVFVGRSFELVRLSLGTRLGVIHPEVVDEERHGRGRGGRRGRNKRRRFRPVLGDLCCGV